MSYTFVTYGHPCDKSFNHAILEAVTAGLDKTGKKYKVIGLHANGLDPNYSTEELFLYKDGGTADPLVTEYQRLVDGVDSLIVLSPAWWSYLMSDVKEFFDKVVKKLRAYIDTKTGLKGKLQHISKSWVVATAIAPKWYLRSFAGSLIEGTSISMIIKSLGLRNVRWTHFSQINKQGGGCHEKFLREIREQTEKFGGRDSARRLGSRLSEEAEASFRLSDSGKEVDEHDLAGARCRLESVKEPPGALTRADGRTPQHPDGLVDSAGRDVDV